MKVNRLQSNCRGQLVSAGVKSCSNAWRMIPAHIIDMGTASVKTVLVCISRLCTVFRAVSCSCMHLP